MKYAGNIVKGLFLRRLNRFVARVLVDGEEVVCHVRNTGRCRELLIPGAEVYLEESRNPSRRTPYSMVAVKKGERLINIDAQAPNRVVGEWLSAGEFDPGLTLLKSEYRHGNSRLDFYLEAGERRILMEVKGVTLEEKGVASFPDAPTERGVRHLLELAGAVDMGYEAWVLFVIQMQGVDYFEPNDAIHSAFGEALREAHRRGVRLMALDCRVTPESIEISGVVPIRL